MSDKPIEPTESGSDSKTEPAAEAKTIEAEAISSSTADDAGKSRIFQLAPYRPSPQHKRFAMLAAALALAAALGGLTGSLSTYGLVAPNNDAEPARNLQAALSQVTKDFGALKTSIDTANRAVSGQIAKINERFDRSEKAQAEPAAKIAALTDTVARLERRMAANAAASSDITGSIPQRTASAPAKDTSKTPIVEGWVLREIYRGRAVLESRNTLYEVTPGAELPGVGRVQNITKQDGRWVVVTAKGLIVSVR